MRHRTIGVVLAIMVLALASAAGNAAASPGTNDDFALNPCITVGSTTAAGDAHYNASQGTLKVVVHGATLYGRQLLTVFVDGAQGGTFALGGGGSGQTRDATFGPPTLVEVKASTTGQTLFSTSC